KRASRPAAPPSPASEARSTSLSRTPSGAFTRGWTSGTESADRSGGPRRSACAREGARLTKCFAADHDALDLARALVDPRDADVAEVALDGEVLGVAVAAVDLHRAIAHPPGGLAGEELGHRRLRREALAPLLHLRRAEGEQARRVEL